MLYIYYPIICYMYYPIICYMYYPIIFLIFGFRAFVSSVFLSVIVQVVTQTSFNFCTNIFLYVEDYCDNMSNF